MGFMGNIFLPIDMMMETAVRLETTGEQMRSEIEGHIKVARAMAQELPGQLRDTECDLEAAFQLHLDHLLTARRTIAQLIRRAGETASRLDESAGGALTPNQ